MARKKGKKSKRSPKKTIDLTKPQLARPDQENNNAPEGQNVRAVPKPVIQKKPEIQKTLQKTEKLDVAQKPETQGKSVSRQQPDTERQRGVVSMATCLGGMFLTLVLGLYLGSLLPEMLEQEPRGQDQREVMKMPPQPWPQADTLSKTGPVGESMPKPPRDPEIPPEIARQIAELREMLKKDENSAPLWTELGNLYFDTSRYEEAIQAYEHSLSIAPGNPDVLTDLGIMYREHGDFTKALDCFRKAVAINPEHQNALFNEGVILGVDLGKKDEATRAWNRLLEINPDARTPDGKPLAEMIDKLR